MIPTKKEPIYPKGFFFNSDRFRVWGLVCKTFKDKCITGFGLGTYTLSNIGSTNIHWQHLHNEYLQVVFELGLIGLILVLWCIWDYFKTPLKTDLTIRLASIFFGFCFVSGMLSPAHLWLTSVIGLMSYAGLYIIKNEVVNGTKNSVGFKDTNRY